MAQLINLSVLNALYPMGGTANIEQAFSGTGAAPFSVTVPANWRVQTLQVIPLALHYELTRWDRHRVPPYAVVGLGTYVKISNQVTTGGFARMRSCRPKRWLPSRRCLPATRRYQGRWSEDKLRPRLSSSSAESRPGRAASMSGYRSGVAWNGASARFSTAIDSRYNYAPGGTSYNETISRIGWHF